MSMLLCLKSTLTLKSGIEAIGSVGWVVPAAIESTLANRRARPTGSPTFSLGPSVKVGEPVGDRPERGNRAITADRTTRPTSS